jgi:hypothetical protein
MPQAASAPAAAFASEDGAAAGEGAAAATTAAAAASVHHAVKIVLIVHCSCSRYLCLPAHPLLVLLQSLRVHAAQSAFSSPSCDCSLRLLLPASPVTPVMLDAWGVDLLDSRCTPANVLHVFRCRAWVRRMEDVDPLRDV